MSPTQPPIEGDTDRNHGLESEGTTDPRPDALSEAEPSTEERFSEATDESDETGPVYAADTIDAAALFSEAIEAADTAQDGEVGEPAERADVMAVGEQGAGATAASAEDLNGVEVAQRDEHLLAICEALIFAAPKPVTLQQLRTISGASTQQLRQAIIELQAKYDAGIELAEAAGGYHFRTPSRWSHWVRRLMAVKPQRLTRAMLETLAIVAYRQPVTRPEIDDIRGVDCGGTLRVLLERNLVRILGKKEEIGRPLLYGTTKQFLQFFQLKDLKSLPTLRELTELSDAIEAAELDPTHTADAEPDSAQADTAQTGDNEPQPLEFFRLDDQPELEAQRQTEGDEALAALERALETADDAIERFTKPQKDDDPARQSQAASNPLAQQAAEQPSDGSGC